MLIIVRADLLLGSILWKVSIVICLGLAKPAEYAALKLQWHGGDLISGDRTSPLIAFHNTSVLIPGPDDMPAHIKSSMFGCALTYVFATFLFLPFHFSATLSKIIISCILALISSEFL